MTLSTATETRSEPFPGHPRASLAEEPCPTRPLAVLPAQPFEYDVAIVGLGYVGLPTALAYHASGTRVLGVDVSASRLATIRADGADLLVDDHERLRAALDDDRFELSSDTALLSRAQAVVVCVPTPVDEYLLPDLRILKSACASVVAAAVPGQTLVLTSTTYAGCTRDMLVEPLAARGLTAGEELSVAFSPERIDPGSDGFAHEEVPRVVGGATAACRERAAAVLQRYTRSVHRVDSLEAAEMTKLLENTFRAVNIALANEFADACRAIGVSVIDVISAAATKPYGFMPFYPGPGVGGHCIPCDPHYLLWQLRKVHVVTPVIEQAMSDIARRPHSVVERAHHALSDRGLATSGATVLVVGVTYKPNVADLRESPALEILSELAAAGAHVSYTDPYVSSLALPSGAQLRSVHEPTSLHPDLVILHTEHDAVDHSWLAAEPMVLDTTYRAAYLPARVTL